MANNTLIQPYAVEAEVIFPLDNRSSRVFNSPVDPAQSVVLMFPNLAAVRSAIIPTALTTIGVAGYAMEGDCFRAWALNRVSAPTPARSYHVQSADGAWWIYAVNKLNPQMFGAQLDVTTFDNVVSLMNFHDAVYALSIPGIIPAGTYYCLSVMVWNDSNMLANTPLITGQHPGVVFNFPNLIGLPGSMAFQITNNLGLNQCFNGYSAYRNIQIIDNQAG